ncbi:MAG: ketopantoate reductase family protein [Actinocrinis sp.]
MRLLIAGAGAVGGFLAARLLDGGHEVTVLARPRRAEVLRADGLAIREAGRVRTAQPRVITADEVTASYDAVVLAVKADALAGIMDDIAPAIVDQAGVSQAGVSHAGRAGTAIVPFLNGMGHLDRLGERFGDATVGGVAHMVTQLSDDRVVDVLAPLFEVEVGELDGSSTARIEALGAAFKDAGAHVAIRADIVAAMWAKWVFIASVGAVTGLMRAPVGDVVAVPGGDEFARGIVAEAAGVAAAAGYPLTADQVAAVERTVTAPGSPTTSSMSRDLTSGRKTEVEAVIADLVDRGRPLGAAVPNLTIAALALRVHNRQFAAAHGSDPKATSTSTSTSTTTTGQ